MDIGVILIVAALAVGGYFLWTRVIAPRLHRNATPTPTPTTTRDYPQPKRYHDDDIAGV